MITKRVQIISKKKFAIVALDSSKEVFVMHIVYLGSKISIYLVFKAQIALLLFKKVIFLAKHLNYLDNFSKKLVAKLPKRFIINKPLIDLELIK